jgi:ribosomal protein S18 acetylase RimI-like enzyme
MMTPIAPQPIRPAGTMHVIQGYFPGGRPTILQPAVALRSAPRPAPAMPPTVVGPSRATGPILPRTATPLLPKSTSPFPGQPLVPPAARPAAVQPSGGNAVALPPSFQLRPSTLGQRLPEPVQRKMEAFFGADFSQVRVHIGPEAASIGALAFTHGTDLYFAPGQYNPTTPQGQRLLGHELTHVVQQRAGRVRNPLGSGVAVVQDPGLEAEAERQGQRASSMVVKDEMSHAPAQPSRGGPILPPGTERGAAQLKSGPGFHVRLSPPDQAGGQRIVATSSGTPIGSVEVRPSSADRVEICNLKVAPEHRRRGVGKTLVSAAIQSARSQGVGVAELEARPSDASIPSQALVSMYRGLGFHCVGFTSRGNPRMEARFGTDRTLQARMSRIGSALHGPSHAVAHRNAPTVGKVHGPIGRRPGAILPCLLRPGGFRAAVEAAVHASSSAAIRSGSVVQRAAASGLSSTTTSEDGQIYGIWQNEEYPNKIAMTSLTEAKCLYVGKTARGEDLGGRFIEHVNNDTGKPWCLDQGNDYSDEDDDRWPYVVRNVWQFKQLTKLDVAIAEQYYMQEYKSKGAPLLNARNEITAKKFAELKDDPAFTTKATYPPSWKPKDLGKP